MTMDEITRRMGVTRAKLASNTGRGTKQGMIWRREFVMLAFVVGHEIDRIADYICRPPHMVLHTLRFVLSERDGGPYGRSPEQLRKVVDARITA
jgi:hypothetical protein